MTQKRPDPRELVELPDFYHFKVIVKPELMDEAGFLKVMDDTLDRDPGKVKLQSRPSKKGNYLSYTLRVFIQQFEEIEAIYEAYRKQPAVVMVL